MLQNRWYNYNFRSLFLTTILQMRIGEIIMYGDVFRQFWIIAMLKREFSRSYKNSSRWGMYRPTPTTLDPSLTVSAVLRRVSMECSGFFVGRVYAHSLTHWRPPSPKLETIINVLKSALGMLSKLKTCT